MSEIATVKVTLTIEIDVGAGWENDCSLSQVYKQAEESARGVIRNKIGSMAVVVGTPKIEAVVVRK